MQKVLDRYVKQIAKQLKRRNRRGSDSFTSNEEKAIVSYGRAAQQIKALIDAPTPEWTYLKFEKSVIL